MNANDIIKQLKDRYIIHPRERINGLIKDINNNDYGELSIRALKNDLNGIVIARNNFNKQAFDFYVRSLHSLFNNSLLIDTLEEQFNIIADLLDDLVKNAKNDINNIDVSICDALLNELDQFDQIITNYDNNKSSKENISLYPESYDDAIAKMEEYTSNTKRELNKKPSIMYADLFKYRNYLNSLIRFFRDLESKIDINEQIDYDYIELSDKISLVLSNCDSIMILQNVIDKKTYNEISLNNDFVCSRLKKFETNISRLKNVSLKEVLELIIKDKASIRQLIKLIDENIPDNRIDHSNDKKENGELINESEKSRSNNSFEQYDLLVNEKDKATDKLNSIYLKEQELRNEQQELDRSFSIIKQNGDKIDIKKAIRECQLRMTLKNYKESAKISLKDKIQDLKFQIDNYKFSMSDILNVIRFNSIYLLTIMLYGKKSVIDRDNPYKNNKIEKKNNRQKRLAI